MSKPRVLIVDESAVIRRALSTALTRDARVDVVGSAPNGRTALMKIPLLEPDVVVLDIDMPARDAFTTLAAIRQQFAGLPVVMLAPATPAGLAATIEAVACGASDCITKPDGSVPSEHALQMACNELASKLDQCRPAVIAREVSATCGAGPVGANQRRPGLVHPPRRVDILAIGVSTGGPGALMAIIPSLPVDFPVPVVIVQHMPPIFTRLLAERLAATSRLPVSEGQTGMPVTPGRVWIAPGDHHLFVERDGDAVRLMTSRSAPENSCRPAVDVLFRSVARVYGSHALAVVMTGMGQDGLRGCQQIHAAGGQVLAQDQSSSVVWGMPGFVARAGIADQIVPLSGLSAAITDRVWRHRESTHAGAVNGTRATL